MKRILPFVILLQFGDAPRQPDILVWCDCSVGTVFTIADGGEVSIN